MISLQPLAPLFITVRKRSLGQGNIFIGVCQEFCSRDGVYSLGGVCSGGRGVSGPWGCLLLGGCLLCGVSAPGGCLLLGVSATGGCLLQGDVCYWGCLLLGGVCSQGEGVSALGDGFCSQGVCLVETPPGRILLWTVRILLECILVYLCKRKLVAVRKSMIVQTPWTKLYL